MTHNHFTVISSSFLSARHCNKWAINVQFNSYLRNQTVGRLTPGFPISTVGPAVDDSSEIRRSKKKTIQWIDRGGAQLLEFCGPCIGVEESPQRNGSRSRQIGLRRKKWWRWWVGAQFSRGFVYLPIFAPFQLSLRKPRLRKEKTPENNEPIRNRGQFRTFHRLFNVLHNVPSGAYKQNIQIKVVEKLKVVFRRSNLCN